MNRQPSETTAAVVNEILARYAIETSPLRRWQRYLGDLAAVLVRDYETPIAQYVAAGELPLRELDRYARAALPGFGMRALPFASTLARVQDRRRGLGVKVTLTPYGNPGHPFRGFYVHTGTHDPLIWVNRQHTPTAMGATFAHELGHHFWRSMSASADVDSQPRILRHDGFADHLEDPRELFADAFAALAGYPRDAAERLFARRRWGRANSAGGRAALAMITRVEGHIHRHYPGDLGPSSGLPPARRLYYLGSMVHFSKVRAAILRVTGI